MSSWSNLFQKYKNQVLSFDGEPKFVAKGFALGSFIGMLPIPGFHILSSIGLAILLNLNKKSVFLGVIKTNLLTAGFIFSFNYWVGKKLLNNHSEFDFSGLNNFYTIGIEIYLCLVIGGIMMGILSAIVNYYIVFIWLKRYRKYAIS
ncbi:MAG: DUF2062 domain-containing protein [Moheibacter sp.]